MPPFLRPRFWDREPDRPGSLDVSPAVSPTAAMLMDARRVSFLLRTASHLLFAVGFLWPALTMPMLVRLFAAYLFLDGVLALAPGGGSWRDRRVWPLVLGGMLGVVAAIVVYGWPEPGFAILVPLAASWAVAVGASYTTACLTLREADPDHLLLLNGIVSLLFGRALLSQLAGDLVVLSSWMGLYALAMGVVTLKLSVKQYRLLSW